MPNLNDQVRESRVDYDLALSDAEDSQRNFHERELSSRIAISRSIKYFADVILFCFAPDTATQLQPLDLSKFPSSLSDNEEGK